MMRAVIAITFFVTAACGDKSPPPRSPEPVTAEPSTRPAPASPGEAIIARMDAFKQQLCACKNPVCIKQVDDAMSTWAIEHMEELKDIKPTPDEDARAEAISVAMDACRETVASASKSPPSTVADVLDQMGSFRDRMCACKDRVCSEYAEREAKEWLEANAGAMQKLEPTKTEGETGGKINDEMKACRAKLASE